MLAELLQVARNLTAQKIDIPLSHEDFGKPGLSGHATFKVALDINGKIVKIESLLTQDAAGLWTLKKGKKRFFPCIRISAPLIQLEPNDSRWKAVSDGSPDDVREFFSSITHDSVQPVDLSGLCNEYVERISRWQPPEGTVFIDQIHNFAKAFSLFAKNPKDVSKAIVDAVEAKLRQHISDEEMRMLLALLVGVRKESKKKGFTVEYKVQICLDFSPEDDLTFTLYQPRVSRIVLQCLNSEITPKTNIGICSLGGCGPLLRGSFPEWSVPPVISMPLSPFSKFSEAECNYRYGRADQDAFPVSADIARGLVGALRQLTSDEFKGRTWCPLKSGKLEKKKDREDILIAYPSFTASELSVVKLISNQQHEEDDAGNPYKRFADTAEPVIRAIKSRVAKSDLVEYLTLLLIRQISPGQIQLAYSAMPTIHEFGDAIQAWEMSGKNLPANLCVPLPSKTSSSGFSCLPPRLLFPEDASRVLSQQWIRDGTESMRLEGPSVGMVLDLFLRKPGVWQESAEQLLELTLMRTEALLVGAGHILHRDDRSTFELWKKFIATAQSGKERRRPDYSLSQTISLIGSLLYAMNSTVQDYKNESAYLVGKLLAMMDELHRCYCEVVRDGDIPNALIGNGLLGRAAESPALALEELAERSRIYIGWAKSVGNADEKKKIAVNSARKILRLAQPLAEQLHTEQLLEKELSAVGKAHLFLGYLSSVLGCDDKESHQVMTP